MKTTMSLIVAAMAAATSCAAPRPYAPIREVRYSAIGADPFWMLTIGDDRIVVRFGHERGQRANESDEAAFPRTLPRKANGALVWRSGEAPGAIEIEARPGPCTGSGGLVYEDRVTVLLSPLLLSGCGGRILAGGRS